MNKNEDKKTKIWISIIVSIFMVVIIITSFTDLLKKSRLNDSLTINPDYGILTDTGYYNNYLGWRLKMPVYTNVFIQFDTVDNNQGTIKLINICSIGDSTILIKSTLDRLASFPKIKNPSDYNQIFESQFAKISEQNKADYKIDYNTLTIDDKVFTRLDIKIFNDKETLADIIVLYRFLDYFILGFSIRSDKYNSFEDLLSILNESTFEK